MIDGSKYEGQSFLWGSRDCYGLLRQIYLNEFGIKLTNFARPVAWRADAVNLIIQNHPRDGWEMIADWKAKDLRPGDVLAIAMNESNPNHLGIYLGDNKFAHHIYNHLSRVDPLRTHWLHHTCCILRHPDVPDLRAPKTDTPIEELLRARHQV